MLNNVTEIGRLSKDVDFNYSQNGTAYARFVLAVQRGYKNKDNFRKADFIPCIIWGKRAEALADNSCKGSLISINGRIESNSYVNAKEERIFTLEIVVETFDFLESKEITEKRKNGQMNNQKETNFTEDKTIKTPNSVDHFPVSSFESFDQSINDNDLPY